MKSSYTIFIIPKAGKDLDSLEKREFSRIQTIIQKISYDPRPHGSLKLTGDEGYRIRVGTFRIIYRIDDKAKKVFIYRVQHRKDVYR
jgi:mRNA interferase RelE/StbE